MSQARTSSERAFLAVAALLSVASAAVTVAWSVSMSAMGGMPMPGGWTMTMVWMRMPGQTWPGAAAEFVGMWTVMMVAMMLPSLVPMLRRFRQAARGTGTARLGWLTALVGTAYFLVWTVIGAAVFPLGAMLAGIVMRQPALSRVVPLAAAAVVLVAGILQFTRWKARRLFSCPEPLGRGGTRSPDAATAWRLGLRLAVDCGQCCAGLMAIPVVVGIMDLRAMGAVAAVITAERLAADRGRAARAIGGGVVAAGLVLVASATGLV